MEFKIDTPLTFFGGLQLIFVAAKLFKMVSWSWWIVLLPPWVQLISIIVIVTTNYIVKNTGDYNDTHSKFT